MALRSSAILPLILCLSFSAYGKLHELATKQTVENLRYISKDGKVTFYQNTSGTLYYSTNYKVKPILKSTPATQYNLTISAHKKAVLIEKNATQFNFLSIRAPREIYLAKYKKTSATLVGHGLKPRLHLKDSWLSYYNAQKRELHFVGIKNRSSKFTIKLRNQVNPYYIPYVVMLSDNLVLFTDINIKGIKGIIQFNRKSKKLSPLVKSSNPLEKIEICANDQQLFIGIFGQSQSKVGSSISSYKYKSEDISKRDLIYESSLNDIGNMKCSHNSKLYFVKRREKNAVDVAVLDLVSKKHSFLSDSGVITQITEMDGKILAESMGKYFLVDGDNNLGDDIWKGDDKK
ncbi:MAG: hypothetical protein KAG61_00225 [Bacteriovoracaceae bacterium]|nr:hypothetical protein [Bacteriovoracaceae bacterium]